MKKIFKHIFAMFLKTKVIFVGLITLVFFTAVIFTTLFTTNRAYGDRLDEYKNFSGLHDATINTEFNYFGNAQNEGYDELKPEVYQPLENEKSKKQLIIKDNFISLGSISPHLSNDEYVLSTEFSREFYFNATLNDDNTFSLSKQAFLPVYITNDGKNFQKKVKSYSVTTADTITLDRTNYKANDILVYYKQGDKIIINFANPLVINGITKQATFDPILGSSWQRQGIGFELKGPDLYSLLKIKQKVEGDFEIENTSSSFVTFTQNANSINARFNTKTFNLTKDINWSSNEFKILDPGQNYQLLPNWVRDLRSRIEYINHKYKLKEIDENSQNFTGFIKEYLLYLKNNEPKQFQELQNINYWEKRIITTEGDHETIVSADLSISDLTVEFQKKGEPSFVSTIAQIEKLNNNNLALVTNEELNNLSNSNIKNATFLKLSQNVQEYANIYFYNYLQNYSQKVNGRDVKVVDSIGTRQTFTIDVQQKGQDSTTNQVIHFINSGISPEIFNKISFQNQNLDQQQQLGRLFNEIQDYKSNRETKLFPQVGKILDNSNTKIPAIFQAKVIAAAHESYGIDPNLIDLKVTFGNVEFQDDQKLLYQNILNTKIVLLKKVQDENPIATTNTSANLDFHGIILLPNYQFGYVFKNLGEIKWTLLPENIIKTDNTNPGSREQRTQALLANFLENKNFEIDAKISDSGWFKRVDNYSNTATIPLIYYYFSTNVQNEIDTQKSARSLFLQAADALNNSVLVDNGFFLKPDVDAIFNALALAADEIKLVDILAFRIKNYNLLSELLVKAGHILTKNNRPTIINDVLANFVDQIIHKTEQSATTNSERSLYLVRQIFSLNSILSAFGVDIFDQIQRLGGIEALAKAIKNPINLLNGFQKVIYSIDFEKLLDKLNAWFEENNKNKSNLISLFSGVDFIKEFLASIDQQRIKAGLIDIVNEIDFNAMFSTVVDEKTKGFFGFLTRPIVERFAKNKQAEIIKILTKLNGKGENNPYSNINEGLIELITNFDIPTFVKNLDYLTKNVFSDGYDKYLNLPENLKKAQADKEFFKRTELQVNDYLIALVGTFLKDEKTRQSTINSLIKIINASSKGQDSGSGQIGLRYFLPGVDDQKIDIYDLQFISSNWNSVANTDNLQKSKQIDVLASSVLTKLSENPEIKITNLTLNERIFLNRYLRIVNLDNVEDIKNRLQEIKDIFEIFNFKNYTKTGNIITNIKPPSLDDTNIFANYESIGDILYFLTNSIKIPASQVEDGNASAATPLKLRPIYISASADLIDKLQDSITSDPSSIIGLAVRNYRFWIRFVAENNLPNLELQQAFNKLYSFANSSSTNAILNDTQLFGGIKNLQNQEGLFAGLPAASRSILQPYLTSLHLNNNTEFRNLLNDPVFDKQYTDQHGNTKTIKTWLIENQTELVENLGYLAYYSQNYPFEANFNKSVKYIMDNFLLENKFSDSPFKKRFLSTLVSQYATLNPLLVGLNLESLGLGQFFSAQLPQIPLWFSTNPDAQIETEANNFNLAFILQSRIPSIRQVQGDPSTQQSQLIDLLSSQIKNNEEIPPFIHSNLASSVSLDYYKLKDISALIFEKSKDNPEFFGINIYKFYEKFFEKIIVTRIASNSINIDDNRAYVIKVNNSYLEKNQKEIYQGQIPDNASDIEKLIDQLDDKYILNAAGLKYIIVGSDFSVDYLYPVIDEKNIQLDPSNQALAYVNKFGFDKARFSYRSNPVKNYLLIKLKPQGNLEQFKQDTDDLIAKNFSLNRLQRTFSADEIDFLNPERSLRISVGTNIISTFSSINIYITLFLSLLVLFAVAFIIKRYISTNNKVLGILRAQGYTLFEIASSFLSIGLMISFIGGLLGYLVGFFVKIPLVGLISQFWEFDVNLYSFEPISFVFSFVVPFIAISALIYLVILWNLKQKPNQLLSGISEINTSKFAQGVARLFRKTKIVNKFSISLVINSTWKIISLIIAIIIVQFALIFSLSSHNIFQNTITKTYLNRHYTYKLNLFSPSREGGPLVVYNPKNLEKNLYVPIGSGSEINTNSPNYFRPGNPSVFGDTNQNGEINTNSKNPVVLSRSGLNIKISESNNLSIFDIVLSNLPESLRNNIFSISNKVVLQMEQSQNIEERIANKQPYFKYLADPGNINLGRFWYFKFDPVKNDYLAHEVSIFGQVKNRDEYRKFLVESYLNANVEKDFTVSFAGISLSPNADKNAPQNQVYTYIDTSYNNGSSIENGLKIYGYNTQSQNNPIIEIKDESNQDLLKVINDFKIENDIYPLVVNHVFAKKHNLGIDSLIEMPIINTIDRYLAKIRDIPQKTAKFKIIGISDTYINSELITSQDVANKLLGLDIYDSVLEFYNLKPFNGLILASPDIEQITNSFTLYSPSGYWAGSSEINVDSLNNDDTIGYFANIFAFSQDEQGQKGALQLAGYSKDEILKIINLKNQQQNATWVNQNSNLDFSSLTDPTFVNQNLSSIKQSLKNFNEIYGNTIYQIATQGVEAKNIETNFISNFANLFGAGINIVVIVFLAVSLIILIIIASSIINENQENIAILDVLGYSNRTKLRLFYSIYLPILILATLISVPFAMLGMGIFSSYILASNSIFLALAISVPVFFGALLIISVIFFSVLAILWRFLTNRKSVYVIKEKT